MKKHFLKALAIVMLGASSFTLTSCDEDTLGSLINVITNLIGQQGETYTYETNGTVQWGALASTGGYKWETTGRALTATIPVTVNGQTANITIPGFSTDGVVMTDVSLYYLPMTNTGSYTTLDLGDNSTIDGSITVGNTQLAASNVYMYDIRLTSEEMMIGTLDLYFGDNLDYCVHLTNVSGSIVTE